MSTDNQNDDAAQHRLAVTFFTDKFARTQEVLELTLPELGNEILAEDQPTKAALPWLKLMRFGSKASSAGCLRTNANAIVLTGIEVEHDAGTISFADAVQRMEDETIACIVYTSPSYVPGVKERWRILLPCSVEMPLGSRAALVARVNGMFNGELADESFNLSQAYLFGAVKGNPHHQVVVLDYCNFIDGCDDLDEGAIGKRKGATVDAGAGTAQGYTEDDIAQMLERSRTEGEWHNAMLAATASMVSRGWTDERICAACAPYADGAEHDADIAEMIRSARAKWKVPDPDSQPDWAAGPIGDFIRERVASGAGPGMFTPMIQFSDFYAYMADHKYIHIPTGALWPAASVNARLPKVGTLKPALWLDQNRHVEQMTWAPGEEVEIRDRILVDGGWVKHDGIRSYNLYRAPRRDFTAGDIRLWRDHLERIYPGEAGEIELWCAQRAQRPADKLNHAMVMGGRQGIGKDTLLEPLRRAVGAWNFAEVTPMQMMGRFNGFLRSVVVRVNEVRDRGETDRYGFYNHSKILIAAPPDTLMIDEKNTKEYRIPNVLGMVITANEKRSLYLPGDDRRHFVAWSELCKDDFDADYWTRLWRWYYQGGLDAVAAHLLAVDLSGFDAKRPPRQTVAFRDIVSLSCAPEDADMADALDYCGRPDAVTLSDIMDAANKTKNFDFAGYLRNPGNGPKLKFRFEECGYTPVLNPDSQAGHWRVGDRRQTIYARSELNQGARVAAARKRAELPENVVPLKPKKPGE